MDHGEEGGLWRAIGACEQASYDFEERIDRLERQIALRLLLVGLTATFIGTLLGHFIAGIITSYLRAGPGEGRPVMSVQSEINERAAGLPKFTVAGVEFECFVALDQEGTPYVWRSACKRAAVGRVGALIWARYENRLIGSQFASLKIAMIAAAAAVPVAPASAPQRPSKSAAA